MSIVGTRMSVVVGGALFLGSIVGTLNVLPINLMALHRPPPVHAIIYLAFLGTTLFDLIWFLLIAVGGVLIVRRNRNAMLFLLAGYFFWGGGTLLWVIFGRRDVMGEILRDRLLWLLPNLIGFVYSSLIYRMKRTHST